ncbi:MAG: cyclic nucleotide-binding domain-containing protein [Acetobacteraceae bacterium]
MDDVHLWLQDQPLLRSLAPQHVACVRQITRSAQFAADEFVFHAAEPADQFYLLRDGLVALQMQPRDGPITLATIGAGEFLGVSWLLTPRTWTWDARALQAVSALAIDVGQLIALCEQEHSLGYRFMKQVGSVLEWRFLNTALQAADLYADWS